jgi:hypothetical protein
MRRPRASAGFTLLEVLVVTGLLGLLLGSLVQITSRGAELFDRGNRGQELTDQAMAIQRRTSEALGAIVGPRPGWRGDSSIDTRLLVHRAPMGISAELRRDQDAIAPAAIGFVLRATVHIDNATETALLRPALRAFLERTEDGPVDDETLDRAVADWPRRGRGELLLLPWRTDTQGLRLELRMGVRLVDPELAGDDAPLAPQIVTLEDLALTPDFVLQNTKVIARNLLHVDLDFWSQRTRSWDARAGGGPERSWDSARAGLLRHEPPQAADFGLDLDAASLEDPRDDVWPRAIRVTLVVAAGPNSPPDGYLAGGITADELSMLVTRPEELPETTADPFVKIGAEWLRIGDVSGRRVDGLIRGQRGTTAIAHGSGEPIHVGRASTFMVPLHCGRDADD